MENDISHDAHDNEQDNDFYEIGFNDLFHKINAANAANGMSDAYRNFEVIPHEKIAENFGISSVDLQEGITEVAATYLARSLADIATSGSQGEFAVNVITLIVELNAALRAIIPTLAPKQFNLIARHAIVRTMADSGSVGMVFANQFLNTLQDGINEKVENLTPAITNYLRNGELVGVIGDTYVEAIEDFVSSDDQDDQDDSETEDDA